MPVNRDHAFSDGPVFRRPKRRPWSFPWTPEARAWHAWRQYQCSAVVKKGCLLGPNAWCINSLGKPELIELREQVVCRGLLRIEKFGSGRILVHPKAYIGDDTLFSSSIGIEVGASSLLAHGVQIFDNDSHPLDPADRISDYGAVLANSGRGAIGAAPVRIGEGAWIGFNAIILKGVSIGDGSIVAAGSVVTRDVPASSVAAGNPAIVIRSLASGATPR